MNKVITLTGNLYHYSEDGVTTLCGKAVSSGGDGERCCKRCQTKADKLTDDRDRLEYAVRAAETQDDVMAQADYREPYEVYARWAVGPVMTREQYEAKGAQIKADAAAGKLSTNPYEWGTDMDDVRANLHTVEPEQAQPVESERVPMSIMATDADGEEFEYANVPNGDPERVTHFVAEAQRCPNFTNVLAIPDPEHTPYAISVAAEASESVKADPEVTEDVKTPETGVQSREEYEAETAAQWADVDAGDRHYADTDPDRFPETTTARAANGHVMEYRVTGVEPDGRYKVSQWDTWHSDTCPCVGESDEF